MAKFKQECCGKIFDNLFKMKTEYFVSDMTRRYGWKVDHISYGYGLSFEFPYIAKRATIHYDKQIGFRK